MLALCPRSLRTSLRSQKTTWGSKKAHRRQPGFHRKKTLLFNNISGSITAPWRSAATELVTDADDMLLGGRAGEKAKGIKKRNMTRRNKSLWRRGARPRDPGARHRQSPAASQGRPTSRRSAETRAGTCRGTGRPPRRAGTEGPRSLLDMAEAPESPRTAELLLLTSGHSWPSLAPRTATSGLQAQTHPSANGSRGWTGKIWQPRCSSGASTVGKGSRAGVQGSGPVAGRLCIAGTPGDAGTVPPPPRDREDADVTPWDVEGSRL